MQRHYGAAAREIEQERARKLAAERPVAAKEEFPFAISCKDPASEQTKVQELYKAFQHAKEKTGDSMEGLTIESFKEFVLQKTDQLKQEKNAHEIEYVVTLEDNHAKLKMRVKS